MQLRTIAFTLMAAAALAAAACGGPEPSHEVIARGNDFEPRRLEAPVGEQVTFRNADEVAHTFTADDGAFDSGVREPEATFTHVFTTEGRVPFHCEIHPSMQGVVVVQAAGSG